jgi:hypothetical protein
MISHIDHFFGGMGWGEELAVSILRVEEKTVGGWYTNIINILGCVVSHDIVVIISVATWNSNI